MLQRSFSKREGSSSKEEMPNVFRYRRGLYHVLSDEYLHRRLADARTLRDFQALVDLAELGSFNEMRRYNYRESYRLAKWAQRVRASVVLHSRRFSFDFRTTD